MSKRDMNFIRISMAIPLIALALILGWGTKTYEIAGVVPMVLFIGGVLSIMTIETKPNKHE